MTRGITEQEVTAAADGLLLAGERPTIERVRRALGRGSPNTVNRHLDTWWKGLARRVGAGEGVERWPQALELAFQTLWQEALVTAQTAADGRLHSDRKALQDETDALARARAELEAREAALAQAKTLMESELAGLRDRLAQERAAGRELGAARDAATKERAEIDKKATRLASQLEVLQERMEGNQKHFTERYAARDAEHEREVRRLKSELERLREAGRSDRAALTKAERELAASRGELAAVQRSEAQLRDRLIPKARVARRRRKAPPTASA
jgi:chromosome segregation ATPase